MFGQNPIEKVVPSDGLVLRVVKGSPFYTIQGEGPYAGHPAIFVRLHGCNLRCWFCDTQFSDPADPEIRMDDLVDTILDVRKALLQKSDVKLCVITGGEPLRQNIIPLVMSLVGCGFTVQIETAGTVWPLGFEACIAIHPSRIKIVCSPKTGSVHPMIEQFAACYKYVIGADTLVDDVSGLIFASTQDPDGKLRPLASPSEECPVYLSPMDEYDPDKNAANLQRVGELALKHGYIAGVQMHKLMRIQEP